MKIDIHSHYIPEAFIQKVKTDPTRFRIKVEQREGREFFVHQEGFAYPLFDSFYDVRTKIADLDAKRLELSVLSAPPTLFYYWTDVETASEVCRVYNDSVSEFVRANPGRFAGMAIVPLQDVEASVKELQRCHDELGLRAVEVGSHVEGRQFDDPSFMPFFEKAEELGMLVFFHPYYIGNKAGLEKYYLTNLLGNPIDTSVAISHIILGGLLQKCPNLKLYFAHGGGFIPYQMGRLEHGHRVRQESRVHLEQNPVQDIKKLIFDSIVFRPEMLKFLVDVQGEDQIVLGTDFPFDMGEEDPYGFVMNTAGLSDSQKRKIVGENAARLLRL
ncbi:MULTISPECIES: amidohydrolase family protein [unclassified Paenibacillus]|uniref:amidohydrolase family protein n=1 Tax=unclassified Paenibacillus TaxID=185978 RepID=UPI001AEA34CB|nr:MULTISPECIES: amidohydrolase family protein [unclassified Paenibacillus]MBP1153711.1 aminocarboxymuconate-semialdehyde decarboxylase [Paenibacillus sp. PvP091]MBP1170904.1 aminocarboxymuconate-semialdehyde decarboxylase [Paenibacillus sp. PvR098]MBP2441932.1 aminocarboxymuconate-semialdehyde decarboxylase [Paenibacillus sp. PvP052]